jgi:carbon monoxide dehydrogenase subunit G
MLRWCRALLADVSHSRGCGAAAGVDVLSAEEVMMVAWVVDAQVGWQMASLFGYSMHLVSQCLYNVPIACLRIRLPGSLATHKSAPW